MGFMRTFIITALFIISSCGSRPVERVAGFRRILPDTSKSWAGRMTREVFQQTRILQGKLDLPTLANGIKNDELRIWNLSSSYEPQVVQILYRLNNNQWVLRSMSFYRNKGDSMTMDSKRIIRSDRIDSFDFNQFWSLPSQSDLKAGDSYGCMDGGDVFIEIADSIRYKFMWYKCPDIHKNKDSVFLFVNQLLEKIQYLVEQNQELLNGKYREFGKMPASE
jgi:hypothetical protein